MQPRSQLLCALEEQSPDISQGVTEGEGLYKEQGAGDQGMMFGFACNETEELMPLPITLAHKLMIKHADARFSGELEFLRPDAKSQITVEYDEANNPQRLDAIVLSTQHERGRIPLDEVALEEPARRRRNGSSRNGTRARART